MKKILGLDIGTTSVGWAIVELNDDSSKNKILGLGSRIIPLTTDEEQEFTKGNAITKNRERTNKRTARKTLHRYKLRKSELKALLKTLNIDLDEKLFHLSAIKLYGLRDKAVKSKIELNELARIWFHLNQKRGYQSSRKSNNEEESSSEYLKAISDREAKLNINGNYTTIGSFFYKELLDADKIGEQVTIKKNIFNRASYVKEFDLIFDKQKEYYPEILTEDLRTTLKDEIIFYQRRLKSAKHLVGCLLYTSPSPRD